ncbi:MAG: formate--tetrahydrofolate ligase [Sandaracinaceae bacterium]
MTTRSIHEVADQLEIAAEHRTPYGRGALKIAHAAMEGSSRKGKLVGVTAITPTPAGEGKTTTSVSLAMGLDRIGTKSIVALREPSLGPVFGIKGGGTGGGKATIEPQDTINLHFTGDLHAIGSAHNLLAALIDNALHFRSDLGLDARRVTWPRVMDMNDRALRDIMVAMGGHGAPRQTRFDITAASEVMATLCLAESLSDLRDRLARIVIGQRADRSEVTAGDLDAADAMTALLKDALEPNLAQTSEGTPALVHGGPFANIAHGCSSVVGTRMGLALADVCVTEGGFGFDLGGSKLLDIACRSGGFWPDLMVVVATARALKMHGGAPLKECAARNDEALAAGLGNLDAHLDGVAAFGLPAVVAINRFADDADEELALIRAHCEARGSVAVPCEGFAKGGEGAEDLARAVKKALDASTGTSPQYLYDVADSYETKIEAIATKLWGADGVTFEPAARRAIKRFEKNGHGGLPVCPAKTFRSISDNAKLVGRPTGFTVTVREVRLAAGAGFVVPVLGDTMTMPGLPRRPASKDVRILDNGRITGLMQEA